ncbi:MAG: rod shape-determining protein MreD [Clostridium sp.]
MKKTITLILIVCSLLVLDNTIIPMMDINNYYPSLLFIFVVIYSIINGPIDAVILGAFSGILQDVYFFNGIGINAFINLLICVAAAQFGKNIFKERMFIPIMSIFLFSVIKGISLYCILYVLGKEISLQASIYSGIYNMVIAVFMYRFIYKLSEKRYMKREWKF